MFPLFHKNEFRSCAIEPVDRRSGDNHTICNLDSFPHALPFANKIGKRLNYIVHHLLLYSIQVRRLRSALQSCRAEEGSSYFFLSLPADESSSTAEEGMLFQRAGADLYHLPDCLFSGGIKTWLPCLLLYTRRLKETQAQLNACPPTRSSLSSPLAPDVLTVVKYCDITGKNGQTTSVEP